MALADMVALWKVDTLQISISYIEIEMELFVEKGRVKYHCCWSSGWVIW